MKHVGQTLAIAGLTGSVLVPATAYYGPGVVDSISDAIAPVTGTLLLLNQARQFKALPDGPCEGVQATLPAEPTQEAAQRCALDEPRVTFVYYPDGTHTRKSTKKLAGDFALWAADLTNDTVHPKTSVRRASGVALRYLLDDNPSGCADLDRPWVSAAAIAEKTDGNFGDADYVIGVNPQPACVPAVAGQTELTNARQADIFPIPGDMLKKLRDQKPGFAPKGLTTEELENNIALFGAIHEWFGHAVGGLGHAGTLKSQNYSIIQSDASGGTTLDLGPFMGSEIAYTVYGDTNNTMGSGYFDGKPGTITPYQLEQLELPRKALGMETEAQVIRMTTGIEPVTINHANEQTTAVVVPFNDSVKLPKSLDSLDEAVFTVVRPVSKDNDPTVSLYVARSNDHTTALVTTFATNEKPTKVRIGDTTVIVTRDGNNVTFECEPTAK